MCPFVQSPQGRPESVLDGNSSERLAELEGARRVQQSLFPQRLPRVPGWEFSARCRPARAVAGDYLDLFEVGPGRLAVALGDVSDKGLGPALVAAGLHALLRCRLPERAGDLAGLLTESDAYLRASLPEGMFVTLFLGVLDVRSGRLDYVNAGHPGPLVLSGPEAEPLALTEGGAVLGIIPGASYRPGHCLLGPGSLVAVFSDGITEARGSARELFGLRRVVETLRAGWGSPAAEAADRLLGAVERFSGRAEPDDDVSLIVVRRAAVAEAFDRTIDQGGRRL